MTTRPDSTQKGGHRRWTVAFLGDPDYGRDTWEMATGSVVIEAVDASTAAKRAIAQWLRDDLTAREEGWYGDGTIVGVQELVEPPPVKTFIVTDGRPKLER